MNKKRQKVKQINTTHHERKRLPSTVIPNTHESLFLASSVATHSTEVVPIVKLVPEVGVQVTLGSCPELSTAAGFSKTMKAVGCPLFVLIVWSAGQVITGASVSITEQTNVLLQHVQLYVTYRYHSLISTFCSMVEPISPKITLHVFNSVI